MAGLAEHLHVGQEAHGDGTDALAFAAGAAALAGIEAEAPGPIAARLGLQRLGEQLADGVPEADVGGGAAARRFADGGLIDFQHAVNGLESRQAGAAGERGKLPGGHGVAAGPGGALRHQRLHAGEQHVAREGGFAGTGHAGDGDQALEGDGGVDVLQVVQVGAVQGQPANGVIFLVFFAGFQRRLVFYCFTFRSNLRHRPACLQRVLHGVQQVAPGLGIAGAGDVFHGALGDQPPATLAGAGADVDDVVGTADGVFVVLHHHQRVALVAEGLQRVQQDPVVARMQADGRLVEHIAHALQVAAELRRQADALGLAAAERGRTAVQREVAQADLFEEFEAAFDFRHQVAGDLAVAASQGQCVHPLADVRDGQARQVGDADAGSTGHHPVAELHGACRGVQPRALAGRADGVGDVFGFGRGKGLLAALVVVVAHRVVEHLALLLRQLHARAHTVGAPAVLAVVGEQARVELRVARAAHRAGAQRGKGQQLANARRRRACLHGCAQAVQVAQHMDHALAVLQGARQRIAQQGLVLGLDVQAQDRQLDGVFLEAVDAREAGGRQEVAVHAQVGVAARAGPIGQLRVDALAVHDQRRQQADVLPAKLRHQLRGDALRRLRLHRRAVMDAMLHAELHIQQAQEMPDLGGGTHRALAPAARQALLDRDRRRDAIHGVHLGPAGRLHDAARVGVQALQIAALALVEQDVERQRGLARAADPRDHAELAARDVDAERLEVVLAGIDDLDGVVGPRRLAARAGDQLQRHAFFRAVAAHAKRPVVLAQGLARVRSGVQAHILGRALGDDQAAGVAAFGAEVDQPVAGADHVEVVLDHHQRVPGIQQLAQGAHQLGDVVEVQPGGGLIEQEQRAFARRGLAAGTGALCRLRQKAGKLQALRLAARQRRHRLAQLDVFQPNIDDGLQRADHLAVVGEHRCGLADGQVQHVGHVHHARMRRAQRLAFDGDLQDFGPVAFAVTVRAAQVHIAEKLHLHVFEARAATGRAAPVAAVEAEFARGVAALA